MSDAEARDDVPMDGDKLVEMLRDVVNGAEFDGPEEDRETWDKLKASTKFSGIVDFPS